MKRLILVIPFLCALAFGQQNTLDTDTFSGTAGTLLHTYNANWINSTINNNCGDNIISNPNGGVADGGANSTDCDYRIGQTWTNDQFAQATLSNVAASFGLICVRFAAGTGNNQSGYCAGSGAALNAGDYFIFAYTNGARSTLATIVQTPANGDVLNFQVQGTTLVFKVNAIQISSITDSTFSTGNPGLFIQHSDATTKVLSVWSAGSVGNSKPGATILPKTTVLPKTVVF